MENDKLTFEEKLKKLEEIAVALDRSEEPLEILLEKYEEGMKLAKTARDFLDKAERKVIEISNEYSPKDEIEDVDD